jgi:hypothetical protein
LLSDPHIIYSPLFWGLSVRHRYSRHFSFSFDIHSAGDTVSSFPASPGEDACQCINGTVELWDQLTGGACETVALRWDCSGYSVVSALISAAHYFILKTAIMLHPPLFYCRAFPQHPTVPGSFGAAGDARRARAARPVLSASQSRRADSGAHTLCR